MQRPHAVIRERDFEGDHYPRVSLMSFCADGELLIRQDDASIVFSAHQAVELAGLIHPITYHLRQWVIRRDVTPAEAAAWARAAKAVGR